MEDQDTWWYVCKLCYRAFSGEVASKTHKQNAHQGVRGIHVMILGQAEDLSPHVRLTPCTVKLLSPSPDKTVQAEQDRLLDLGDVESCSMNLETLGDIPGGPEDAPEPEVTRHTSHGRARTRRIGMMRMRSKSRLKAKSPGQETATALLPESAHSTPKSPDDGPTDTATQFYCKLCSLGFPTLARLKKHVLLAHEPDPHTCTTLDSLDIKEEKLLESDELPDDLKLETEDGIHVLEEVDLPSETAAVSDPNPTIRRDLLQIEDVLEDVEEELRINSPNLQTSDITASTDTEDKQPEMKRRLRPRKPKLVRETVSEDSDSEDQNDWNLEDEDTSASEGEMNGTLLYSDRLYRQQPCKPMPRVLLECLAEDTRRPDRHICILCFKAFPRVRKLEYHIRSIHYDHLGNFAQRKKCECLACYKDAFLRTPAGGTDGTGKALGFWECNLCQQSMHESRIKFHVQRVHAEHTLPNVGPEAMSSEWSVDNLTLTNKCSKNGNTAQPPLPNPADASGTSRTHECGICSKKYPRKTGLHSHLRMAHCSNVRRTCPKCQKQCANASSLRSHMKSCHVDSKVSKGTKNYLCPTCGRAFKSNDSLKHHTLVNHGDGEPEGTMPTGKFLCDVCPKTFFTSWSLKLHKTKHVTVRTKMCPICGLMFKSDLHLSLHHKHRHTDIRPYKCKLCEASFKQSGGLQRHAAKHIDEKTFPCSLCTKSYKTKIHLTRHVSCAHLKKGQPSNFCQLCPEPKEFPGTLSLYNHQLEVHDFQRVGNFECKYCHKKFARQFNLDAHLPMHTNERKLACETCGKTFKLSTHLHQHRFTHLSYEELPNACDVCGKRFGLLSQLRAHKQRIHQQTIEVKRRGPAMLSKSQTSSK